MVQEMVFTCQDTQLNVWTPCEAYKVTARILERPRPPGCSPAQLWGSWQPEDKMRADQVLWIPLLLSIKCVRHTGVWLHCIDSRNFTKPFNRRKFSMGKMGCTSNPTQAYCYSKKKYFSALLGDQIANFSGSKGDFLVHRNRSTFCPKWALRTHTHASLGGSIFHSWTGITMWGSSVGMIQIGLTNG